MFSSKNNFYLISIFLHCFVLFCAALYIFIADFFEDEVEEEKFVFEMVDIAPMRPMPTPNEPVPIPTPSPAQSKVDDFIAPPKLAEAKPIELPPAPKIVPVPKPTPKQAQKPKPTPTPAQGGGRVNMPPKKPAQQVVSKPVQKPIPYTPIVSASSNLNSVVNSSYQSSASMNDAINAYTNLLKLMAKARHILPASVMGMHLSVSITFDVSASGLVSNLRVKRSSGNTAFDKSVISAFTGLNGGATPDSKAMKIELIFESI